MIYGHGYWCNTQRRTTCNPFNLTSNQQVDGWIFRQDKLLLSFWNRPDLNLAKLFVVYAEKKGSVPLDLPMEPSRVVLYPTRIMSEIC